MSNVHGAGELLSGGGWIALSKERQRVSFTQALQRPGPAFSASQECVH